MIKKSSRGVICVALVVGFFLAAPSSRRPPLNPAVSALLIRAEDKDVDAKEPDIDVISEEGTVCSGAPDFAKGVTEGSYPILNLPASKNPVFEKDRKQAVLALIHYPYQELDYSIVFLGSRLGYRAMTLTAKRRIEVYVRPGEGIMHQAFDLAHELGHAFDLKYNTEERRRKWRAMRGIKSSTPWFGCDACPDYATPAGDFAETFAYLLLGPGNFHSLIAAAPNADQVEQLAEFCNIDQVSETLIPRLPGKPPIQSAKEEKHHPAEHKPEPAAEPVKASVQPEPPEEATAPVTDQKQPETTPSQENKPEELQSAPADISNAADAPKQEESTKNPESQIADTPEPAPAN